MSDRPYNTVTLRGPDGDFDVTSRDRPDDLEALAELARELCDLPEDAEVLGFGVSMTDRDPFGPPSEVEVRWR